MSKLIVSPSSIDIIPKIISRVDGILIGYQNLSVGTNFTVNIDEIKKIRKEYPNKELCIKLNKMMHNKDLPLVEETLKALKEIKVDKIFFYDLGVYNIAKRLDMTNLMVINQEHLNTSIGSNNFYYNEGILSTYLTDDITYEELMEIRNNYKGIIYKTIYGYLPIFYSRRYLITNYMNYINKDIETGIHYMKHDGVDYPIIEEDYGTIIYTKQPLNIIKEKEKLKDIDYLIIDGVCLDDQKLADAINKYTNNCSDDGYEGFFHTKTIYRVKR